MKLLFIFRLMFVIAAALPLRAQTFTFSDTYPTNNLDSLENWVKTHPQPTGERLKNLIRLHRTWRYGYIEKIERYLPELKFLSYRINNPVGNAFYNLQSAYFRFKNGHHFTDLEATQKALATFEALKDTSGVINALADLVQFNFDADGSEIGSQYFAKEYLDKIEVMLKHRPNVHDYFYAEYVKFKYYNSKHYTDYKALITSFHKTLALCESNPDYVYAWVIINNILSVLYNRDNQHDKSYQLESAILRKLKPEQTKERLRTLQNIMISCEGLKKYDELLEMAYRESKLLHECYDLGKPIDPIFHTNLHLTLKHEMTRRKRYSEALLYSDSLYYAQLILYDYRRKQNLNDLQAKFKAVENQKQIAELTLQQTQDENRNHLILMLLSIAIVAAIVFGILGLRLRQANARLQHLTNVRDQFFGMVAHDLRRPMFAFQGIKALVSFHLRKQNYAAIEKLSIALDESGLRLQKMLDNLVSWAMSQQEVLPYQPQNLRLHERVQTIVDLYSGVNLLKNVRFEVDIPESLTAYADPNGFDLIVRNLIDNSFKALSKEGNLRISARLSENQELLLKLEDNAGGMTAEILDIVQSVFDAPERAQIGEKNMGMGLIMVGRFVKRNRGQINVESVAGRGTTFRIGLPR